MTATPLFAYGTLQDTDILYAVLGRVVSETALISAHIDGFSTVYYPGRVYPALLARPGAVSAGHLITTLSASDWAALDAFEGTEYRRSRCMVVTVDGHMVAELYMPSSPMPADAAPWTLDTWRQCHKPAVLDAETAQARRARDSVARGKPNL